ncbi:MAG: hypothetical protein ACRD8U_10565, partial [Pyrinomonadaceae bacterium]
MPSSTSPRQSDRPEVRTLLALVFMQSIITHLGATLILVSAFSYSSAQTGAKVRDTDTNKSIANGTE